MPIYEFRCDACGHIFELLAMGSDDQSEACCPQCQGKDLSRVMSACSSVVHGSKNAPGSQASLETHTCENAGSCSTLTLPGVD
jgi:putative FmdB family regulatory protein